MVYLVILLDEGRGIEIQHIPPRDNYKRFIENHLKYEAGTYKYEVFDRLTIKFNPIKDEQDANRN
jgi:hypothetical protein